MPAFLAPLAGLAARAGGSTLLFALLDLLSKKSGRAAIKGLGRQLIGKGSADTVGRVAPRIIAGKALRRATIPAAGFTALDLALGGLQGEQGPSPESLMEIERARRFLNPPPQQAAELDIEQLLAMLLAQQQSAQPEGLPFT